MTEMQREAEARLCNSTAGFIVTGLCVISLGVVVDMFWVCIVGLVSLVLAGLRRSIRGIPYPARTNRAGHETETRNILYVAV